MPSFSLFFHQPVVKASIYTLLLLKLESRRIALVTTVTGWKMLFHQQLQLTKAFQN